jgi:hypothetical protein
MKRWTEVWPSHPRRGLTARGRCEASRGDTYPRECGEARKGGEVLRNLMWVNFLYDNQLQSCDYWTSCAICNNSPASRPKLHSDGTASSQEMLCIWTYVAGLKQLKCILKKSWNVKHLCFNTWCGFESRLPFWLTIIFVNCRVSLNLNIHSF